MSINYCTLSSSTVNTFCGAKRALVLARLIPELHPVVPPVPKKGGNVQQAKFQNYRQPEKWEPPIVPTERDRIVVSVEFQNLRGSDEQLITEHLDIVFITELQVNPTTVSVNIENLKVN
jgi:hypothetical protein